MSMNIEQIFIANPITTNASTDLMYFGQSPYGAGNDAAMTFANFNAQIVGSGTANDLAYFATTGHAVSALATANNGVLVTSAAGVPSILAGPGATGRFLSSNAAAAPSWSTATFPAVGGAAGNILISDGTNYIASTSLWPNTVGTAGKILRSDGTTNAYTTSTFADTYAVSTLLYAGTANTVTGLATTNSAALVTNGSGVPAWQAMSAGQILIGTTAGAPTAAAINSGTGIIVANGSGSITVSATGGGLGIATISGTTQTAAVNTTYIALNSGQTTLTLPAVYAVGDIIRLVGATANTGGWIVQTAAGDTVRVNNATTSAGGTVTCTAVAGQCIELVCDVANGSWVMTSTSSVLLTTA